MVKTRYVKLCKLKREERYLQYLLSDIDYGSLYVNGYIESLIKDQSHYITNYIAMYEHFAQDFVIEAVNALFDATETAPWYEKQCQANPELLRKARWQFCEYHDIPF